MIAVAMREDSVQASFDCDGVIYRGAVTDAQPTVGDWMTLSLSNSFSEMTTHYYGHPDGYRLEGTGRAAIDEIRKEVVKRRQVVTLNHEELIAELEAE